MKLSEQIERKFISQKAVEDYEVLTDTGWKSITGVGKTVPYEIYKLKTSKHSLKCADTHIVFDEGMNEVYVKDVEVGQLVATEDGFEEVLSVNRTDVEDNMYDIQVDSEDHRYYTDGILSHNSTIYCIYALWYTMFFPEKKIMILANKATTALELLSRIATAYEYLPNWIKCTCTEFNKSSLTFGNMSVIKAFPSSSDAARGFSANCVILDEFAFLQKNIADKLFTSMYPVISSSKNGKFILVSTPNGTGNLYYDIWCQANSKDKGKNKEGWKPFTMFWWQVPGHDDEWKEKQIAAIGAQRFAQEFNNEFLTPSTVQKLIPSDILEKHRIKLSEMKALDKELVLGKKQNIFSEKGDKLYEFTMWHEFKPEKTYLATGDCSEGVGGDSSVLYVWDVTDLRNIIQCAKFSSNMVTPIEFAFITSRLLKVYNNPYYICERNGIGSGYLDALSLIYNYPRCVNEGKNNELGIFSHVTVKEKACVWAREMMTTQGFGWTFYDKDLLNEMDVFVKKDTKSARNVYAALDPAHDDHVMTWIWCCYLLNPELIDKYFICVKTFTSTLEKVYPQLLQPMMEYTVDELANVSNDPLHKEFLDFKEEMTHKIGQAVMKELEEDKNDMFFKNTRKSVDPFFQDDDGPSWNRGGFSGQSSNPLNRPRPFYLC